MGVFSALSKVFTARSAQPEVHVIREDGDDSFDSVREAVAEMRPGEPVMVNDIDDDDMPVPIPSGTGDSMIEATPAPRNKQELIAELSKSYNEVVLLIRKVDDHLDRQDTRSQRLLEIAERLPVAIDRLGEIRDQHAELSGAVVSLTDAIKQGNARSDDAMGSQLRSLERVEGLLQESGEAEREMGESIREFKGSVSEMAGANSRLGEVLDTIQKRDAMRDTRLQEMIERTQRWVFVLFLLCVVGLIAVVAAMIVFRN